MNSKKYFKFLLVFGLAFICNAQSVQDSTQKSTDTGVSKYGDNFLNGHRFISNSSIKSPFIHTYLKTRLGIGKTSRLEIPVIVINGTELITLRGDLAYSTLNFEYQQAVKDWIAFSGKFDVIGRLGTDVQALLSQGVNLNIGFEFGWLLKLYRNDNMMLSGLLKLNNNSYTIIDFYGFAQGIIDSGTITPQNKIVKNTPATVAFAGLSYAYAINRMFGITASAAMGYGESAERFSEDEWISDYGVSADADLKPDYSIPLGFTLSYYGLARGKNGASIFGNPQNIFFQINYTGKNDIDLGLVFEYQWFTKESINQTINFTNIFLDIKYYF